MSTEQVDKEIQPKTEKRFWELKSAEFDRLMDKLSLKEKIIGSFMVGTVLVLIMGGVALWNAVLMDNQFGFVIEHDAPVIENTQTLMKLVVDMKTGQRGFLITGNDLFLEPYINEEKEFSRLID
ncbi:MAG: CHASE3 domain-containing protein [Flavobacteriales bacterium]|nr:CHASE3 domain-containing protein [Flavobacteriales bacterium]